MADKKVSQMTEMVGSIIGTNLLPIVGNTASVPTNYRVQVKNFVGGLLVDMPQTTWAGLRLQANVAANAVSATLAAGEVVLTANAASGYTVRDRIGLIVTNQQFGANSNTTGLLIGARITLDPGTSNAVSGNTFGLLLEHTIANTSEARIVAPRAFIGFKEHAGTAGQPTTFLLDVGAMGNSVTSNLTTGNASALVSVANNYTELDINRTLKISVNGQTYWLLASNVAPDNT